MTVTGDHALAQALAENERLNALVGELGLHLTALCNHPTNWEYRYDTEHGRPCPGCYDARDKYENHFGGDAR